MAKDSNFFDPDLLARIDSDPLFGESDRGCVLVCAADIENKLTDAIEIFFDECSSPSKTEKKALFDYSGPLGTFSSKIALAKVLGLLNGRLHSDIQKLRRIRNWAAHSSDGFSLSEPSLEALVRSMETAQDQRGELQRYSPVESADSVDTDEGSGRKNENMMKGYGYLRAVKVDFILTTQWIAIELGKIEAIAKVSGGMYCRARKKVAEDLDKLHQTARAESELSNVLEQATVDVEDA